MGRPAHLGQAVDNLISNAVKFTPAGGRVAVTIGTGGDDDERASICVSDTGVGIPAEEMDRLSPGSSGRPSPPRMRYPALVSVTPSPGQSRWRTAVELGGQHGRRGASFTLELPRLITTREKVTPE